MSSETARFETRAEFYLHVLAQAKPSRPAPLRSAGEAKRPRPAPAAQAKPSDPVLARGRGPRGEASAKARSRGRSPSGPHANAWGLVRARARAASNIFSLQAKAGEKERSDLSRLCVERKDGRGDRIRTCDPLVPNQMRYQTAPLPD
jgi:hypothetical protein